MISAKYRIFISLCATGMLALLFACDDPPPANKKPASSVVEKAISLEKEDASQSADKNIKQDSTEKKDQDGAEKEAEITDPSSSDTMLAHYDSKGKIDPFRPLVQEKVEEKSAVQDDTPKRIKTPLEKLDLSQIRLVAIILAPRTSKHIAMVEEASGKGYEVQVGTYIGRHEGKVSEIKDGSIVVREITKDFKGKLKEKFHEIKLHKTNGE